MHHHLFPQSKRQHACASLTLLTFCSFAIKKGMPSTPPVPDVMMMLQSTVFGLLKGITELGSFES
jgi:hypothetical protein